MEFKKPPLSYEEKQIHAELLGIAEGMGRAKEISVLNHQQKQVIQSLKQKGYVSLTKKRFVVLLPVD